MKEALVFFFSLEALATSIAESPDVFFNHSSSCCVLGIKDNLLLRIRRIQLAKFDLSG